MKRKLLLALLLWSLGGVMSVAQAAAAARIYGRNLASYQIVYAAGAEAEEGNDAAAYVHLITQAEFLEPTGPFFPLPWHAVFYHSTTLKE